MSPEDHYRKAEDLLSEIGAEWGKAPGWAIIGKGLCAITHAALSNSRVARQMSHTPLDE